MTNKAPNPRERLILEEPNYREAVRCLEFSILAHQPSLRKGRDHTEYVRALYDNSIRALAKYNTESGIAEISPEQLGDLLDVSTARAIGELEEIGESGPLSVPDPLQNIPEEIWIRIAARFEPREQKAA